MSRRYECMVQGGFAVGGKLIPLFENLLTFLTLSQFLKAAQDRDTPVSNMQLVACASFSALLTVLEIAAAYILQPKSHVEYSTATNDYIEIPGADGDDGDESIPVYKKVSAVMYIAEGALVQAGLDFSGLYMALYNMVDKPKEFPGGLYGYYGVVSFMAFIGLSHGFVEGVGTRAQSMRIEKWLSNAEPKALNDYPWAGRFLSVVGNTSLVFMSVMGYCLGVLNSVANLIGFYSGDHLSKMNRFMIGGGVALSVLPMVYADYMVVMTKVMFTYWTFGFDKKFEPGACSSPMGTLLSKLSMSCQKFFCCGEASSLHEQQARMFYVSKILTRMLMLSGLICNALQVFTASKQDPEYQNYSILIAVLPLLIIAFAALSAHLQSVIYAYAAADAAPACENEESAGWFGRLFLLSKKQNDPLRPRLETLENETSVSSLIDDQEDRAPSFGGSSV